MRCETRQWLTDVAQVWDILDEHYMINTDKTCGTHVHISPSGDQVWDIGRLKAICRSIIHFENAIEALVPPARRGNIWAKNNRVDNPRFSMKTDHQCLQLIASCKTPQEIANLMNNSDDRFYTWNFCNGVTIEFRRGPGVIKEEQCLGWVEFAIAFIAAAVRIDPSANSAAFTKDVEGLARFTQAGLKMGMEHSGFMKEVFRGKSGSLRPARMRRLTAEERQISDAKKAEEENKKLIVKKMESLWAEYIV